jgi:type 1 glutamine amidotransferase
MKVRMLKTSLLVVLVIYWVLAGSFMASAKNIDQPQSQKADIYKKKFKIVFLITKDTFNYQAHKTVPVFAEMLRNKFNYDVTVLLGSGDHGSYKYPHIESINEADLLIVFARRIALPHAQMNTIKRYLSKGKPLIGIRTANHAFKVLGKIQEGYEDWPEFVSDIIGCENLGYGPINGGTDVSVLPKAVKHPILKNLKTTQWQSKGNVYLVALTDDKATVLLEGKVNDITQPIAWTRTTGKNKVFYTSLGYTADFETPQFTTLIINAIKWSLDKDY